MSRRQPDAWAGALLLWNSYLSLQDGAPWGACLKLSGGGTALGCAGPWVPARSLALPGPRCHPAFGGPASVLFGLEHALCVPDSPVPFGSPTSAGLSPGGRPSACRSGGQPHDEAPVPASGLRRSAWHTQQRPPFGARGPGVLAKAKRCATATTGMSRTFPPGRLPGHVTRGCVSPGARKGRCWLNAFLSLP